MTYTGHLYDPETGLFYFGARYYDPETGRFLTHDPVAGDALNPPSLHRYLYAYSSPMTYVDLWGEDIDPFYNTKHQLETMGITRPAPVENVGPFVIRARVNDKGEVIGYVAASDKTGQWTDYYLLDSTTDLAKFKRNIKTYGSSTFMNAAEETQREPEWAREYGYSAYMAMKGQGGEAFKSLGRQWISALKDPLWWMVAGPATLAPFVGPASESGAVIDGEGGEVRPVANPRGKAPASPDVSTEGQAPQSPGNSPRVSESTSTNREYISNETTADAQNAYAAEQSNASSASAEIKQLPEFGNMTQGEVHDFLKAHGYSMVEARSGGEVWTKAMPDGNTTAVRIDPANPKSPSDYADAVEHTHKEIVSTEKVRDGNYNPKNAKTYDDRGQETREHRNTHIHNATSN